MAATERDLTHAEFQLLKLLMLNERKPISNADILQLFFGKDVPAETRVVNVYMARIRAKLREISGGEEPITKIRGLGWVFRAPLSPRA
jgi:DNA-binding response OmpR family regulator